VAHQLRCVEKLDAFIDGLSVDAPERVLVPRWILRLMEDPGAVPAVTVPTIMGLPLWTTIVPETNVAVTFCVTNNPSYEVAAVYLIRVEWANS
jgi:hypothetical protein